MKILLAVDGSKYALAAALKCCEIVAFDKASKVKIVSSAEISDSVGTEPFGVSSEFYLSLNEQLKNAAENFVEDTKKLIEKKVGDGIEIETEVLKGSPKATLVEEAKNWGAELVVVGSHGYGFFERLMIGSVSDAVLHHAPCSVLVVKIDDHEEEDKDQ